MADKPKQTPEWARGVFDALVAVREHSNTCLDDSHMGAMAEALGVPVLLIEASQTYDLDAVNALADWWPPMREGGTP